MFRRHVREHGREQRVFGDARVEQRRQAEQGVDATGPLVERRHVGRCVDRWWYGDERGRGYGQARGQFRHGRGWMLEGRNLAVRRTAALAVDRASSRALSGKWGQTRFTSF